MQIFDEKEVSGEIIGIKLELLNFDINNSEAGKGKGINAINVTIEDLETNTSVLIESLGNLFICTDATYEVVLQFNTTDETHSIEYQNHGF